CPRQLAWYDARRGARFGGQGSARLSVRFETADQRDRARLVRPLADRSLQRPLLRRDGDRHRLPPRRTPVSRIRTRYICLLPECPGCVPARARPGRCCPAGPAAAIDRLANTRTVRSPRCVRIATGVDGTAPVCHDNEGYVWQQREQVSP